MGKKSHPLNRVQNADLDDDVDRGSRKHSLLFSCPTFRPQGFRRSSYDSTSPSYRCVVYNEAVTAKFCSAAARTNSDVT